MDTGYKPVLLSAKISGSYINPGESLWVTLEWQNQGDAAAPREYRFYLEGRYGHQRRLENKRHDFYVEGEASPPPTQWQPGEMVAVTLKWDCGGDWSGTYWLRAGILDENGLPLTFRGENGQECRAQELGSIDTSWNLGRPWVREHTHSIERKFQEASPLPTREEKAALRLSDGVEVELSRARPALLAITGEGNRYPLECGAPRAVVREIESGRVFREGEADCVVVWSLTEETKTRAVYCAAVLADGIEAASFEAVWAIDGRVAGISIANRREMPGYELLELRYDSFAEMERGFLLDFWGAGRLIPILGSTPAFFEKKYDVRNAAALYDEQGLLLVESPHIDSLLTTGVSRRNGKQRGFIGGAIVSRVEAGRGVPSIPVKEPPVFTIELADLKGRQPDWQEAAKLWRRGLRPNPAHELYRSTYFYKQLATWGPVPEEHYRKEDSNRLTQNLFQTVTFREIAENAKGFSRLTDGAKQILYIAGWQKGGFDDAYPEPYDAEERCGGLDGLRDCLEELRKYNICTGLHDNFDDVSYGKADTFPDTALDENGEKWRGWVWAAGMTYIMGMRKYMDSGRVRERIKRMCELLPLRETYHLDVLTAEVCRYDFDPEHPASAQDNLEAKLEIVEEFNRQGLDITSEVLTHPFVGKVGFTLHNRIDTESEFIPGDCFVPLTAMIYHGTIGYCAPSRSKRELLWGILLGGQTFYEEDITGELCVSRYYIQNIPAMLLYGLKLEAFERKGNRVSALYEDGSRIDADFASETYTARIGGSLVGENFTTFTLGNEPGTWLAYSMEGGELRRPLPQGMGDTPRAVPLTLQGEVGSVECEIANEKMILHMPAMTPVKVYA